MRAITVLPEDTVLNELYQQAQFKSVILRATDGQRFVLAAIDENWEGFEVGSSSDFAQEISATEQNEELHQFLAQRRRNQERVPLAKARQLLGL